MWQWVFGHRWLRLQMLPTRDRIQRALGVSGRPQGRCDALTYLAILRWSADLIRTNPDILAEFANHVRNYATGEIDFALEPLEAVAVEWLLMGLVSLPPAGVIL